MWNVLLYARGLDQTAIEHILHSSFVRSVCTYMCLRSASSEIEEHGAWRKSEKKQVPVVSHRTTLIAMREFA
jgi:hypothetical protein